MNDRRKITKKTSNGKNFLLRKLEGYKYSEDLQEEPRKNHKIHHKNQEQLLLVLHRQHEHQCVYPPEQQHDAQPDNTLYSHWIQLGLAVAVE